MKNIIIILLLIVIFYLLYQKKKGNTWTNKKSESKSNDLAKYIGKPTKITTSNNLIQSVEWQAPLDKTNGLGKYGGLDIVKVSNYAAKKLHPEIAPVYVIAGKYLNVPEKFMGPLKYASETINIEQIFVPKFSNDNYVKTGEKDLALVTGSCASVTISAITVYFAEDMIKKYKNYKGFSYLLNKPFREEYDTRILAYLCGKGVSPSIPWFDPKTFGEPMVYNGNFDSCKKLKK